ncbi:MAG: hypothetical protein FD161_3817 [Limisphaerales bacterium]|nr:MAG: hypothetical protein FD161_3817 [Limisphaerales bacterium]KAG0507436.1 MAG: hypothetical protein E1N63_3414 [Limisphaerales bacterium]TXT51447.1 MAG: hypothetical protein FD140_1728 [Limisphaerales bacterium]
MLAFASHTNAGQPEAAKPSSDTIDWNKERQFWSFKPPQAQARPLVKNAKWARQPVDYFILARLELKKLSPSAEAERRTLIRRLTLDLTGLPPTPEGVAAFVADKRADAYEQLVERLLASPRFGERMASVWLPLARYAEDQAHQVGNDSTMFYANAFLYREWVMGAFNRDLPYDQFIRFQLAADKFPAAKPEDLAALGFLGLGPKYYNRGRIEVMADEWEDRVDTVTRATLGLTVACARCHDHKFEPITQRDYYALAGVFASVKMVNKTADGKTVEGKVQADKMPADAVHMVEEGTSQNLSIFLRGNPEQQGAVAERSFLKVLSTGEPKPFADGSGRRELAEAIASRDNPLTARVLVNRVWGVLFSKPLVATPSNFGHSGMTPTHPELLDDLAVRFMSGGWSVKSLVRELVLSATYRQTSRDDVKKSAADVANESLWHMNRRRLSIEQWRDSVLAVTGELDLAGGKSLELDDAKNLRRTVHARVSRLKLNDLLMQFDYPDANVHAEKRSATTTPTQKLFMLNSPFMLERAKALAERVTTDASESDAASIQRAYQLLYGRSPESAETAAALAFLRKPATGEVTRWQQYAQALLMANEMLYVD